MSRYFYKVWLRDSRHDADGDPCWVGMLIEADTPAKAGDWGDRLTRDYCLRSKETRFVTSEVILATKEPLPPIDFPIIRYGERCPDKEIGW